MIRYILLCFLSLALFSVKAQDEMEVDWTLYAQDTVPPLYVHSIDLGYDHAHEYAVAIEYPELVPLTSSELQRYRLPEEKGLPEWPEVTLHKGVSAKRGQLDITFIPIVWRDGKYWRIQTFSLKLNRKALASPKGREEADRYASHSVLSTGRWVKLRVADNGIHMLTHHRLKQMGFADPSKVRLYGYGGHLLSESNPSLWSDDLCEVPVWYGDDRLLFYAQGSVRWTLEDDNTFVHTRNPYSDYGYYFLTEDSGSFQSKSAPAASSVGVDIPVVATTPAYALHEVDDYAWFHGGRQLVESYDFASGNRRQYRMTAGGIVTVGNDATLDVCFTHNGTTSTSLAVVIDSVSLGNMSISPISAHTEAVSSLRSYKTKVNPRDSNGVFAVTLTHNRGTGVSGHLDYLRLSYLSWIAMNRPIYATESGIHTYSIVSFGESKGEVVVWRITDATAIEPIAFDKATSTFTADGQRGDVYIAFDTKGSYPMPEVMGPIANQDLHATAPTDYVIIVPSSGKLTAQAERLAALHRAQRGLSVKVVRADEVYNEFSSGTPDATAYRRYMKMLYDRAATADDAPKYLLLFGDGAWDNRMLSSAWKGQSPDDYLLCYEVENSFSAVSSHVVEDYFALLDDGEGASLQLDKVDIGVGRFPVTTAVQAREVVDKVAAYMSNAHAGAWKNTILMLGDDGDSYRHMTDAESVAQMLEAEYPDYMVKRIYWDAFPMEATSTGNSYPAVRKRLLELFKEGALMVNYSGHGAPDVISHELVINKTDMEQVVSPRLPVWVTVSCDITPFDGSAQTFGESAFLNPQGGAIGLLTSTRTTFAEQNRRINYFFSKYVFARDERHRRLSLGDALRLAKCELITTQNSLLDDKSGNKLNYVLIGDPALVVGNTDYQIVVDELNGMPVGSGQQLLLKAGEEVVVRGHVDALDGTPATSFSGILYASVFDNVEKVTCRNNAGGKDVDGNLLTPFTYSERTKKFFVGSDSVRGGEYTFTFRVPMDINYSMESGRINLYAISSTHEYEAKGMCEEFLLGGTADDLTDDGSGPQIQLYLNTPTFVSGGKVNETPLLVAKLEDADGINTAGSIGHSLTAIIDGQASMTYNLNEYYMSDIGGYSQGTVTYMLPELPEGMHTLTFRAWDMMNNSSTATLAFEVVKGLRPDLLHVQAVASLEGTTFVLSHDRPESEVDVCIEVFDFSGRSLWVHSASSVSSSGTYSFTWNHRLPSGQLVGTGVYLYRVVVSSPAGASSVTTQKVVIKR